LNPTPISHGNAPEGDRLDHATYPTTSPAMAKRLAGIDAAPYRRERSDAF
jgi:hypothetical protein